LDDIPAPLSLIMGYTIKPDNWKDTYFGGPKEEDIATTLTAKVKDRLPRVIFSDVVKWDEALSAYTLKLRITPRIDAVTFQGYEIVILELLEAGTENNKVTLTIVARPGAHEAA